MEQSKKSTNCLTCPREVGRQNIREFVGQLREKLVKGGQALLDEHEAQEFAATLHTLGIVENPDDLGAVRALAAQGFELFDFLEAMLDEERAEETQFCVGALKMRARDERTQYDVTLCRSPKGLATGNLEQAVVTRKTI